MLLYIYGILFLLLNLLFYKSKTKVSPFLFFMGVFIVMGFQDAIGTDYIGAKGLYEIIGRGGTGFREDEFGWRILNYMFSSIGLPFSVFICFQAFFNTYILSTFTSQYLKDKGYWFLSFALFYYTFDYMMFHMTGFRQSFAMELCVLCVILVDKEKWHLSLLCLLLARSIHTTAMIMLPVIPIAYLLKYSKWVSKIVSSKILSIALVFLFLATYISKHFFADFLQLFVLGQDMGGYEHYIEELTSDDTVYLIVMYNGILLLLSLYMMNKMEGIYKFLMLMTTISCITSVLFVGSGSLFRLSIYFSIFNIVTIPLIVQFFYKKNKLVGLLLVLFFMAYAIKTSMPYTFGQIGNNHFNDYRFIFQ